MSLYFGWGKQTGSIKKQTLWSVSDGDKCSKKIKQEKGIGVQEGGG